MHVQVISSASEGFGQSNLVVRDSACGRSKTREDTMGDEIKMGQSIESVSQITGVQTLAPPLFPSSYRHPASLFCRLLGNGNIIYGLRKLLGRNVACRSIIRCGCPLLGNIKRVGGVCQRRSGKIKHVFLAHRLREKTCPDINNKFGEFVSGTLVHLIIQQRLLLPRRTPRLKTLSQIW